MTDYKIELYVSQKYSEADIAKLIKEIEDVSSFNYGFRFDGYQISKMNNVEDFEIGIKEQ